METPSSQQTSPDMEKSSNRIPWKLISILIFILLMYTISLFFWSGKNQENGMNGFSKNEDIVVDENSQNSSSKTQETSSVGETSRVESTSTSQGETMGKSNLKDKVTWKNKKFQSFLLDNSWQINMKNSAFSNIWGDENISPISEQSVKVTYPKGSYKPSASPRWGAGFIYNLGENYEEISMSYEIEFAKNFEFVKWGKLPGLCGGSCPRGSEKGEGISVNLWWDKEEKLWISIIWSGWKTLLDEALSSVSAGEKYTIDLGVKLNTPGQSNGSIIVHINGQEILKQENIVLRGIKEVAVDSLFFSTFFWGADQSWATPVETSIIFSNFKIYGTKKQ